MDRSETLALAAPACNICLGLGLRIGRQWGDASVQLRVTSYFPGMF